MALVAPAGTMMLAGTVVELEVTDRETAAPPAGAAAFNVTVPVDELPPVTLVGLSESVDNAVGPTVMKEKTVVSPCVADSPTLIVVEAVKVEIVKLPFESPAGIVILDGTLANDGASLASVTTSPPDGAGSGSVTVPVDGVPPATLFGFTAERRERRVGWRRARPSNVAHEHVEAGVRIVRHKIASI